MGRAALLVRRLESYGAAREALAGRPMRTIGHNTTLMAVDGRVAVLFLGTEVLAFHPSNTVTINSGGWRTVTTKHRINTLLPDHIQIEGTTESGWTGKRPCNERDWVVVTPVDTYEFYDGIIIDL